MKHLWLQVSKIDLEIELTQCKEEGRDLSALDRLVEELLCKDDTDPDFSARVFDFFDLVQAQTVDPAREADEPSDWRSILASTAAQNNPAAAAVDDVTPRIEGAWLGRCAGCLLGKPVEGWHRAKLHDYLSTTDQWPLSDYISIAVPQDVLSRFEIDATLPFKENIGCMVEDDDINYMAVALGSLERFGRSVSSEGIGEYWLDSLPVLRTCTAERIAYRNLMQGLTPPTTATTRNPYREWIGAQIRADVWGYVNPGDPFAAAEMAFRDASISHVKNGIYGALWSAAMNATAMVQDDPVVCVRAGLSVVPSTSRFSSRLSELLQRYQSGHSQAETLDFICQRWDEKNPHDWCHTISNAEVVAMALLYGDGDFEKSICMAVTAGFDTDCNAATVGSVLGAITGARSLPYKWVGILNDRVVTGVRGFGSERISALAKRTAKFTKN